MKKILVAQGEKNELRKLFNTTYPTVLRALEGKVQTHLSVRIRRAAIERGGVEVDHPVN
jgi:hypothetical protein